MNIKNIIESSSKNKAIELLAAGIREQLRVNPSWVERAIVVLYERQTAEEQSSQETCHTNNIGFNKPDARRMSFVAKFLMDGGHLTHKKALEVYAPRVGKYAKQLAHIVYEKNQPKAA